VISVVHLPTFGEVPAVQISPWQDHDAAVIQTVEQTLKANAIALDGIFTDPSIKSDSGHRYPAQGQGCARQALNPDRESPSFILALNLISASRDGSAPSTRCRCIWGSICPGIHFLLQVDLPSALIKRLDGQVGYIRNALREKKISYSSIAREGQSIVIKFRDAGMREKGQSEIERLTPDLALKSAEGAGEFRLTATLTPPAQTETQKSAIEQNITTLRNRVNELGVAEPIIQQQGVDRIVVQLPGVQDTARAKDILGRTASLEIRMVEAHASDPAGRATILQKSGPPKRKRPIRNGIVLRAARQRHRAAAALQAGHPHRRASHQSVADFRFARPAPGGVNRARRPGRAHHARCHA
jgi:preprotein translocase subunit SecD